MLTPLQQKWLNMQGGRTMMDVYLNEEGTPVIYFQAAEGYEKEVPVPDDEEIIRIN